MATKEELISIINQRYKLIETILQTIPEGCEDSLRPMLEACVKLFWKEKCDKEPVWVNGYKEEFNLQKAINDEKFSKYFSPFIISDMHSIRLLGNKSTHINPKPLSASEIGELFERLKRIIKEMEEILGFSIIKIINNVVTKTETKGSEESNTYKGNSIKETSTEKENTKVQELLGKRVNHWVYGEGKIVKEERGKIIVLFGKTRKEYSESDFKNGFIKLINETLPQKPVRITYPPSPPDDIYEKETVCVGSIVLIRDLELEENMRIKIVERRTGIEGEVSVDSAIGGDLLGASVGDCVTIHAEEPYTVEVLKINNSNIVPNIKPIRNGRGPRPPRPISKMTKTIAKQLCVKNNIPISSTVTFASSNESAGRKYWANPNIDVLSQNWTLILNDKIDEKLHIFRIPAGAIQKSQLKVRSDNDNLIDLQIFYGDDNFQDSRSYVVFAPWYIQTISY